MAPPVTWPFRRSTSKFSSAPFVNVHQSFHVVPPDVRSSTHHVLAACAISADAQYFLTTAVWEEQNLNRFQSILSPSTEYSPFPSMIKSSSPPCGIAPITVRRTVDAHTTATFSNLRSRPTAFALTGDGTVVIATGANGSLTLWNALTGHELVDEPGHDQFVHGLSITPDGATIATIDSDTVKLWDSSTMRCFLNHELDPFPYGKSMFGGEWAWYPHSCSLTADARTIFVCGDHFGVQAFDTRSGKRSFSLSNRFSIRAVFRGAFGSVANSRDGRVVVTCGGRGSPSEPQLRVWDMRMERSRSAFSLPEVPYNSLFRKNDYHTMSITPDGARVVVGHTICDTSRGFVSHLLGDLPEDHCFPLTPIQGVVSADGNTVVFVGNGEHGYVCKLEGSQTHVVETLDIGPRGSRVPLGSEIARIYARYLGGGSMPSRNDVIAALSHTERAFAVQTMTDVYCAHVLIRTLQGKKCELQAESLPMQEDPLRFLWRTIYLKMPVAVADRDQHRELARRIMCDARDHRLLTEANFDVLLFGLHIVKHFSEAIADVREVMRDVYKQLSWRLDDVEDAVEGLAQAAESDKRMAFVRFGLALVPVVGGACAALADVTGDVILSLDCEAVVSFLCGNCAALGDLSIEIRNGGEQCEAELELAALAYSQDFFKVLAEENESVKERLERMAADNFGGVEALRSELYGVLLC